ncbi:UNVERIFIED_CONTAM: hypothetical protein Sangu_2495300 [Sesamum angustifolium]|uniref:Uncharacterized protein n=1 Tax=Sesamum angustifolium TaxID=2727405 RepID=A0AAW2KDT7_9LAMI
MHGWQEKILSQIGKTLLIQTIVQAIPSYAMSCFLLPKTLLKEFQLMAVDFFWHDGERRKVHWLAWDKLCSRPLDPRTPSFRVITPAPHNAQSLRVCDLILEDTREWNVPVVNSLFWLEDRDVIFQIPLSFSRELDVMVWRAVWQAKIPNKVKVSHGGLFVVSFRRQHVSSSVSPWSPFLVRFVILIYYRGNCSAFSLAMYLCSASLGGIESSVGISLTGIPPSAGKTKINFDEAILDRGAAMGVGIVARDSAEVCLAWQSLRLERIGSTLVVEAYAARATTLMAWRLQWQELKGIVPLFPDYPPINMISLLSAL